jgi:hypothetical protein
VVSKPARSSTGAGIDLTEADHGKVIVRGKLMAKSLSEVSSCRRGNLFVKDCKVQACEGIGGNKFI